MLWLGIDVGGTFTDLVAYDRASGRLRLEKVLSTPADQSEGMMAGIERLGLALDQVVRLAHGTTVATNTALERNGAPTAVITTAGFRDVLEVGRGNRLDLYNIKAVRPKSLVPRALVFEVAERTLHDGTVLTPLDAKALAKIAQRLKQSKVRAVAICFLHAYANDRNERAAKAVIERLLPGVLVSTSAEVLPEYREYERFATTALNAYVAPRIGRYLTRLQTRVSAAGYSNPVAIMTSNGGTWPADKVVQFPVNSMLSGPAAGVIGAVFVGRASGYGDIITCDMGGTSTDTCLIRDGEFAMSNEGMIGSLPNRVPHIEINSVGAGGGSVAWLGTGGFLNVGPQSAGVMPGPACYGRGGTEATVSDANVALGRLDTARPLGGSLRLDSGLAQGAVERIAGKLGVAAPVMAEGIIKIAVAKMTVAIKEISIMRGHDPRQFTLMVYGGAGPLHGAFIADELGMRRVIVPPMPGNFSAFGLLVADVRHDFTRSRVIATRDLGADELNRVLAELQAAGAAELARDGFAPERQRFEFRLDMRYVGQAFELSVPVPGQVESLAAVEAAFHAVYEKRYSFAVRDPAEIVAIRLAAFGIVDKPSLASALPEGGAATLAAARLGERAIVFDGRAQPIPIYARERLPVGAVIAGPAAIEESGTTTIVPPGFSCQADAIGNLVLERAP